MSDLVVRTIDLAANKVEVQALTGRVFRVLSATGSFTVSIDGGQPVPMAKARGLGSPSAAEFQRLIFTDTSGSANTIQFYVGEQDIVVEDTTTTALAIESVVALNPDAVAFGFKFVALSGVQAFNGVNQFALENVGGGNVLVTTSEGVSTIPPGTKVSVNAPRWKDTLGNISVDASASTANIIYAKQ